MEQPVAEISIPVTKRIGGHTEYKVILISNSPKFSSNYITVNRRYSDILKLHKKILKFFPILPSFPRKTWFRRFDKPIIEQRRRTFELYFNFLLDFIFKNNLSEYNFTKDIFRFFNKK